MKKSDCCFYRIFFYLILFTLLFTSYNVYAQWARTSGPEGGYVYDFASSGSYFYAGTAGGVYVTSDNGNSWAPVNNGFTRYEIFSMTSLGQYVFAGTNHGVFRTSNNGQNWMQIVNGFSSHYDVFSMGASGAIVYAGIWGQGVGVSTDFGNTWVINSDGLGSNYVNDIEILGSTVFAGTETGIYKSTDNGLHWIFASSGIQNYSIKKFAISGSNIFAASYGGGVLVSTNNGNNWSEVNNGLGSVYMNSIAAVGSVIFAASDGMYKSTNNGANWIHSENGLFNLFTNYTLGVNGNTIFTGTFWQGIYRTFDLGATWSFAGSGLKSSIINPGAIESFGNTLYTGAYYQGFFVSQNNGDSWTQVYPTLNVYCFASIGNYRFAGTAGSNIYGNYGVYRSTDNGNTWSEFGMYFTQFVSCFLIKDNYIFAGLSNGGIFRTTFDSPNWEQVIGVPDILTTSDLLLSGSTIYAGIGAGVIKSYDNGNSWDTTGAYSLSAPVLSLILHNGNIYAGTATEGLYKSSNNGLSWYAVNNGTSFGWVHSLASYGQYIFAGTDSGLFMSSNNGTSWVNKNQGFAAVPPVSGLTLLNGYLFAGTYYQSVWRRQVSDIINVNNISSEIPSGYSLGQNYPNPFNPSTKIKFKIPSFGNVKIVVYDAMGKQMGILNDGTLKAGIYETEFNGSGFPSGVYFCRMEAVNFSETIKMIMIK
ncbi:MAG: T9SS type A sorting domain-containing protein [Ignavibacteria bacterium]|nr:T9SS type A sorting domain-containing protein [Ignavibacteria bacterium]